MFALNTVSSRHPQIDVSCTDTTLDPYEIDEHSFNLVLHNYFLVQKYLKNQSKCSLNFQRTKYSGSKTACLLFIYRSSTTLSTQSTNILEIQVAGQHEETEQGPVPYGKKKHHSTSQLPRRAQREMVVLSQIPSTGEALD